MQPKISYKLYTSLLDSFQRFLDSDIIYDRYWGFSENPPYTQEEFREQMFQSLIDRINRVPYDSEAADRGTALNEVIDCMVLGKNSKKIVVQRVRDNGGAVLGLNVTYNEKTFYFKMSLVRELSDYYKGGLPQQFVQAILPTVFGSVLIYGYIDYVLPFLTCDLKTTTRYSVGDFKRHWQHIVYPYILMQNGCNVPDFEYNIVLFDDSDYSTYTESYAFVAERDVPRLSQHCEDFIRFLQENRTLIKDKKIFNLV